MNGGKGIYVGGTLISILISLALYFSGRLETAIFVGLWAPTILNLGQSHPDEDSSLYTLRGFPAPSDRGRAVYPPKLRDGVLSEAGGRAVYALCSGNESKEHAVQTFLDGLVRITKTIMTRVELGGTLFLVAVIGVLLTSRKEEGKSS